ncbi:Ldh family oxidoreductase [Inquilinus limosus]|uniref:Ldh family oxidoreductase n=1 Tax=Inquilinus limosus TaxID=171674 RepID=UPI00042536AD|nr:Ldh family oxidoreductase [Inquilinus limosus]
MERFEGVRLQRAVLEDFAAALLRGAGMSADSAAATARAMTDASARGVDTHGVRLVPFYLDQLENRRVNPTPAVTATRTAPACVVVDADGGLGHLASYRAVEEAARVAEETGLAAAVVTRSAHHGATGVYTLAAAKRGFVAFGCTHADALVVPHGGVKPFYGTNPVSFAAPAPGEEPVLLDMATSAVPLNRVHLRRDTGTPLPPEVAVGPDGIATTDPHVATGLIPVGGLGYGYKGAGLAMMVEILCAALTGMPHGLRMGKFTGPGKPVSIGHFFLLLKPQAFAATGFESSIGAILADLRAQPAQPGQEVMAPGDPEKREALERAALGVPLDRRTWERLVAFAGTVGVAVPEARPDASVDADRSGA